MTVERPSIEFESGLGGGGWGRTTDITIMSRALLRIGLSPTHWSEIQSGIRSNGAARSSDSGQRPGPAAAATRPPAGRDREAVVKADGARHLAAALAVAASAHAAAQAFEPRLLTPAAMQPGTRRPT
jgi:hypothetical protein